MLMRALKLLLPALAAVSLCSVAAHAQTESDALARAKAANERRDYATSFAIYRDLNDKGSGIGARMLGLFYWSGVATTIDHNRACGFFAIAHDRGDATGTELLADCYFHGDGLKQDYTKSAELYLKATNLGMAKGYCALGNQYLTGLGVKKDEAKAAALCRKGADLGDADAQTDLGQMYMTGQGVAQSFTESAKWLQKAVDQQQVNASVLLATQYWNGDGVQRDRDRAASLFLFAAMHGHKKAPAALTKYYFLTGVVPTEKRIVEPVATKAVFWAEVTLRVEPDPSTRDESLKLENLILGIEPAIKAKVDALLAAHRYPPD
jgi:TPR repeat protein